MKKWLILGIESTCDETSAAIVRNGTEVLSNVTISQIKFHKEYGGVVPEVASRKHTENIAFILDKCFKDAQLSHSDIDAVAVANQPGLWGSIIIGVTAAKAFAMANEIPIVGVNHVLGHVYGNYLTKPTPKFPYIALIVSGGHTFIALVKDHFKYEILGKTRDDAAGESYDKVARFLGLGYPGGPIVDKLAAEGDTRVFRFPQARLGDNYDFSFSGLKTAVIDKVYGLTRDPISLDRKTVCDICAGFQQSVIKVLTDKTMAAAKKKRIKSVILAGGVSANQGLRTELQRCCNESKIKLFIPEFKYCTDNAAMIASAGYYKIIRKVYDDLDMNVFAGFSDC